jgi:hypothetical protein
VTAVVHLATGTPGVVRCNRAGMKSNSGSPATVTSSAIPDKVTCKDCRRLMLGDRNGPGRGLPSHKSRRMAGDWR